MSASTLQAYASGVLSAQGQAVTILDGASAAAQRQDHDPHEAEVLSIEEGTHDTRGAIWYI